MQSRCGVRGAMSTAGVSVGIMVTAVAGLAQSSLAQVTFQTVAKANVQAPGLPAGVQFGLTSGGSLSEQALPITNGTALAFQSPLKGTGVTVANDNSAWCDLGSGLALVAREGDQIPGLPAGVLYSTFGNVNVTGTNKVVLLANMVGGGVGASNNEAIFTGTPGALSIVARRGDLAAGLGAGVFLSDFTDTVLPASRDGWLGFASFVAGTGVGTTNNEGYWTISPTGSVNLVARKGAQAPGMPAGAVFSNLIDGATATRVLQVTSNGRALFSGGVTGGGTSFTNDSGIWYGPAGSVQLIAREGDLDPGGTGTNMLGFSQMACNESGDVVYRVTLSGILVGSNVIYKWNNGATTLVIKRGQDAPGLPGLQFNDTMLATNFRTQINNAGNIALPGTVRIITGNGVDSSNNEALWFLTAEGTNLLVAREGDAAPGLPGVTLGSINGFLQQMSLNNNDQIVFLCNLSGAGVGVSNDTALYDWTPSNGLRLIARKGAAITLDDATTPTIESLFPLLWGSGNNGINGGQRSDGKVGFLATFTTLSGGGARTLLASAPGTGSPPCDSIDFNNDTLTPDSGDLDDFIAVLAGGPSACSTFPWPGCNDIDFNNDGFSPDAVDLDAFISRLGGGPCLQ